MKSILILCSALGLMISSVVLTLALHTRDGIPGKFIEIPSGQREFSQSLTNGSTNTGIVSVATANDRVLVSAFSSIFQTVRNHSISFMQDSNELKSQEHAREPTTLFLFGVGLIGLAVFTRRKFS